MKRNYAEISAPGNPENLHNYLHLSQILESGDPGQIHELCKTAFLWKCHAFQREFMRFHTHHAVYPIFPTLLPALTSNLH